MKRLAMALVIGVLCAAGPMTRAFAGEGDHDEAEERRRGHDDDDDDERESAARGGFLGIQAEKGERCVRVVRVLPGTAAAEAGLKEGDGLTTVNGKKVDDVPGLVRLISALGPGSKVRLGVLRGEKASTVKATLRQRPADDDDDEDDDDDDEDDWLIARGGRYHPAALPTHRWEENP